MSPQVKYKDLILGIYKNQIVRFVIASGINTIFGFLAFAFFIFIGLYYPIAVLCSTICGVLFNFQTIGRFVFSSNNNLLIFRFIGVYLVTYLFMTAGIGILIHFGTSAYVAGAILILPTGIISFVLNKRFVFKR